jgi:superfamily II DNA or RNA helicase
MRKPLVQIAFNPTVAKIVGGDAEARDIIASLTSYYVDGYEHMTAFQQKRWDGRSSFFKYGNDTFPAGFAEIVIDELRTKGYEVQRVTRPLPEPLGPERPVIDAFGYDPKYDYQPATMDRLVKNGRMIARVATGGGKSRIARMCHARIGRRTLFVTTRNLLMYQMKEGFEESGYKVGVIGDGEWSPETGDHVINVAMIQTLAQRLEEPDMFDDSADAMRQRRIRKATLDFLGTVDFLIAEEAHEAGGEGYFNVVTACRNAYYALALTATPFMRDMAEGNMRLMARFGRIGIDITEKMLIERGILARPYFRFVPQQEKPFKLFRTTAYPRAVELGIVENATRNREIVEHAVTAAEYGLTTMVLVSRKPHGKLLAELMSIAGLRVKFIFGESKADVRKKALKALGTGELDVLIGSTILDVGVDVPSVGTVILAGGGKAEVAMRQRIGRGLRAKKTGPNVCPVLDFADEHNKHLSGHAQSRKDIIRTTPGFAEQLLPANEGFDWEAMGFRKVRDLRGLARAA